MTRTPKLAFLFLMSTASVVGALNCGDVLQDTDITFISWSNLQQCLKEVNSGIFQNNTTSNIWRLVKTSFDGIENIPMEAFKHLGYVLTAIPLDELRNLSMERIEIVEAFGAIHNSDEVKGFSTEQSSLIAQKVRNEWLGKNPKTYSEYDLISMGEIICQFKISDIEEIHPDAFKNAAELIGNIKNCPQDRLQAFAKLAKHPEAFGDPRKWSKLDVRRLKILSIPKDVELKLFSLNKVSIIGKILNGLPQSDIAVIDKDKLHLNRYFSKENNLKSTTDEFTNNKNKYTETENN